MQQIISQIAKMCSQAELPLAGTSLGIEQMSSVEDGIRKLMAQLAEMRELVKLTGRSVFSVPPTRMRAQILPWPELV
jgi:hypothetical protein